MKFRITPKPGAPIRDPVTMERLKPEGFLVDRVSSYWKRREAEGGVTITVEQGEPAPPLMSADAGGWTEEAHVAASPHDPRPFLPEPPTHAGTRNAPETPKE